MNAEKSRRAMFAACKALGWDEADRKAMYAALKVPSSSSRFNALHWAKVIDHLNRISGYGKPTSGKPASWRTGCDALGGKIASLLAEQKLPWRYLTHGAAGKPSMCKRLAHVDRLEFADAKGLTAIITALVRRGEQEFIRAKGWESS